MNPSLAEIALYVLLALWSVSCGGGGGSGGDPLTGDLATRYAEVEACTGLSAAAPEIRLVPAVACPSGRPCCIDDDFFPCAFDPAQLCGANARYDDGVIVAHPDDPQCGDPIRFEMVRHLLCQNGDIGDACSTEIGFSDPRWSCQ